MTQKDYISLGKPKANKRAKSGSAGRGKTAQKSKADHNQTKSTPYIAISVLALAICGFSYFLWTINGAATEQTPITAQVTPESKPTPESDKVARSNAATTTTDKQDIPPPPEGEDWQYMSDLKHKEVEVAITEVEKKGPYLMQCGTFKDGRRAEKLKAQLAFLGFESRIKVTPGKSGTHHRVQLGPFEMNRDAQKARHKLSKHNINGCKIWLWS